MQITYYPELNFNVLNLTFNLSNFVNAKRSVVIVKGIQTVVDNDLKLLFLSPFFVTLISNHAIVLANAFDPSNPIIPGSDNLIADFYTDFASAQNQLKLNNQLLGLYGHVIVNSTTLQTDTFIGFQVLSTQAMFTSLICGLSSGSLVGISFAQGFTFTAPIISAQLATGTVAFFKAN